MRSRTLQARRILGMFVVGMAGFACGGGEKVHPSAVGGSPGSATPGFDFAACQACAEKACPSQTSSCNSADGCKSLLSCVLGCGVLDPACAASRCASMSTNASVALPVNQWISCAIPACPKECSPSMASAGLEGIGSTTGFGGSGNASVGNLPLGGIGSTGVPQALGGAGIANATGQGGATAGSAGSSSNAGRTSADGGTTGSGLTRGGASGATNGGRGGTGGTGATTPAGGGTGSAAANIKWLSFEDDWADPAVEPNGALGISGALYAFGDDCAQLSWDPVTRCASGSLCEVGANYENWGVAVGFDFHNTGATGTPADTKMTWDPATVGATGVAWEITGTAPGLQLWITNMDPLWGGQCSSDTCSIDGPPDGTASARLTGQIAFNAMSKDDWGGAGTIYTYSPANTLSINFKLAAIRTGAQSFNFCVNRLGIVTRSGG